MKKSRDSGKDKVIETLYEELQRKEKIIERLKEDNKLLMKTALKRASDKLEKK